jgi:hypothetical protein
MIIIIKILLAHLVGDFILQPKSWVTEKEQKKAASFKLYVHVLIHGGLVLLLLWNIRLWLFALLVVLSHLIIDLCKVYFQKQHTQTIWFIIDQLAHFITLIILWYVWFKPDIALLSLWQNPLLWLYITAILFLTVASGIIIQVLLAKWSPHLPEGRGRSLANAGKYIGILERLLAFIFIIVGHWEAVGFLMAAKSVFRFGDLKDSKSIELTEYILIGTLLSFGIAIITAIVFLQIGSLL